MTFINYDLSWAQDIAVGLGAGQFSPMYLCV